MKLFKMAEWEDPVGRWHVSNTNDLVHGSNAWWIPCRILQIPPEEFIDLLVKEYHASHFTYQNNVLLYSWDNYADAHRWMLNMNKIARNKQIMI